MASSEVSLLVCTTLTYLAQNSRRNLSYVLFSGCSDNHVRQKRRRRSQPTVNAKDWRHSWGEIQWDERQAPGVCITIGVLQEQSSRRQQLSETRKAINKLPCRELFELAGRPSVAYEVRDYHYEEGRKAARFDLPFLFKAFETGQAPPPRPGTKNAAKPRAATIHEYLDWTVTANEPKLPTDPVGKRSPFMTMLHPRELACLTTELCKARECSYVGTVVLTVPK